MYPAEDMRLVLSSRRNSGERDENWLRVLSGEMRRLRFNDRDCSSMEKILRKYPKDVRRRDRRNEINVSENESSIVARRELRGDLVT